MMSISTIARSGVDSTQRDRLAAGGRGEHVHAAPLEHARQREDVARVVVDQQHGAGRPDPRRSCCSRSSMRCFSGGRSVTTRCRNSAVSSSSRSGDSTPLTTMLRAMVCSWASSSADSSRPVNTTTGTSARLGVVAHLLQHLEAGHVGQPQIEHDAVARLLAAARSSASAPVPAVTISMSSWPSSSAMLICSAALSSTTSSRLRRGLAYSLMRVKRRFDALGAWSAW